MSSADGVTVRRSDVVAARARIAGFARVTPLEPSPWLSAQAAAPVHLKLECWQRTGSFKIRGAANAVAALDEAALGRGLVAASAGNHGQGVALAGRERGARVTIFVPAGAPATKKDRIRALGAELREAADYDAAEADAVAFAEAAGAHFIHPCADAGVVAGQGTVGLELLEQLPDLRTVIVPVGGGGLLAGVGAALRAADGAAPPDADGAAAPGGARGAVRVVGVQAERTSVMHDSLEAGRVVPTPPQSPTLADGLAGGIDVVSLARVARIVDAIALVDEAEVARAIRLLFHHHGVVAEGAGAVGVAALLRGAVRAEGPTAVVISGGNIDGRRLSEVLGVG